MYLGFRLPLVVPLATLASDLRSRGRVCVIVEAPSQWRKIEPRGFSNLVGRAGSIGGHQVGGDAFHPPNSTLLISSRGRHLWYSLIR